MPLYEYNCKGCGKNFEVRQKFADEPLTVHEECGGPVERLISVPSLHFKGTGFYITDYRSDKYKAAAKQDSGGASSSSTSSESGKKESKPASPSSSSTPSSTPPPKKKD